MTNLSSLFSMMARGESDPSPLRFQHLPQMGDRNLGEEEPTLVYAVPCRFCGSDETKPVSEEHGIYECTRCGELFHRT